MKLTKWRAAGNQYDRELALLHNNGEYVCAIWLDYLNPIGVMTSYNLRVLYPELSKLLKERFHHQYSQDQMKLLQDDIWDFMNRYLALENFV